MDFYVLQVGLLTFFAYLLGSINFAIILCKLFGYPDPRAQGSRNPGATNVLRVSNKYLAILVLFLDGVKGFIPVFIAQYLFYSEILVSFVGLSAFLGHLYPIFFEFKGGKGVATYIGVMLGLSIPAAFLLVVVWVLVALTTRISSLGAIASVAVSPLFLIWFGQYYYLYAVFIMVIFLLYKHKENIQRLKNNEETKMF